MRLEGIWALSQRQNAIPCLLALVARSAKNKTCETKEPCDFVDAMVTPEEREEGVRVDNNLDYPRTILTPSICCENMHGLLGQVKFLRDI